MSAAAAAPRKGGKGGKASKVKRGSVAPLQRANLKSQLRAERRTLEELEGDANLYHELAELESIAAANAGEDDDLPETEYDFFITVLKHWAENTEEDEPLTAGELLEILNATTGETLKEKQAVGDLPPDADFVEYRLGEVKETVEELPGLDVIRAQIDSVSAEIEDLQEQLANLPEVLDPNRVKNTLLWLRYMFLTDEAVRDEYLSKPYDPLVAKELAEAASELEGEALYKKQYTIIWKSLKTKEAKQPTKDAFMAWKAARESGAAEEPTGSAE